MTLKNATTAGLLLFVAVAVVTAVAKSFNQSGSADATAVSAAASSEVADSSRPADALIATFFHSEMRCPTCRKIESYAHTALQDAFADEFRSGELQWQTASYDAPQNSQQVKDYEVFTSTVVLVRWVGGKPSDWRNLERVWEFVNDEAAFKSYVQAEAQEMLSVQ